MRGFISFFMAALWAVSPAYGAQEHLLRLNFLGGQYFFEGQQSSLAGNAAMSYSQARELSSKWNLVALYNGQYRGTKEVTDLVGGGTLFQETMSHRVSTRFIYKLNERWSLKPNAGFKYEVLKETKDEKWFNGLFDYRKADVGMELQRSLDNSSFNIGYSFFPIWFPNYDSLESKTNLGRELAGRRTLDTYNHSVALQWEKPLGARNLLTLNTMGVLRFFPDQRLIQNTGNYSTEKRRDYSTVTGAAFRRAWRLSEQTGMSTSLGLDYTNSRSNQSHFDTSESRFFSRFYDYQDYKLTLGSQMFFGPDPKKAKTASLSFWRSIRDYSARFAQNAAGQYLNETTSLNSYGFNLGGAWPVGEKGLSLRALIQGAWQESNMKYEANYKYEFSTFDYLFGFSYEF